MEPASAAVSAARKGSAPAAPSGTSAVALSESRLDVSWQDNSTDESGFEVHRSVTGPSGTFTLLASTGPDVIRLADTGLAPETEFCYRVRAFRTGLRAATYSQFSAVACATTPPPGPPAPPYAVRALPNNSTSIAVAWIPGSGNEDGFRIERSTDGGASWTTAGTAASGYAPGAFGDLGRVPEQPVCYRVIGFNSQGESAPPNPACTAPPAAPTGLTVVWGAEFIQLAWTDNSGVEDGYVVVIVTTCLMQPESELDRLPASSTGYAHHDWADWWLTAGCQPVGYYVVATRDGGQSDPSNLALFQP